MLPGTPPGDYLIRFRAHGELRLRHDHPEQRHRRARVERVQRVNDHLPARLRLLGRRRDLVDDLADPLVVGRTRPDDHLLRVAPQAYARLGHLHPQDGRRRRRRHPFDRVHLHRGSRLGRRLDVDVLQDAGDHFVVGPRGQRRELLRIGRVGGQRGVGHRAAEHLVGAGRRYVLQVVHHRLRRLLRRRTGRQLLDQLGDLLVVLRPRPNHQLARVHPGHKPGLPERALQKTGHVVAAAPRSHPLQRVDDDRRVLRALHVDLLERGGDPVVILRPRPGDQLVGLRALR